MSPTLLIAEGDADLREIYALLFAQGGYDVQTAADGPECLEKVRRLTPGVLILDRGLRGCGAEGVLAWLREHNTTAAVSVVLTTTAGSATEPFGDAQPPVVKLLHKPFALAALLESVPPAFAACRAREGLNLDRAAACS